MAKPYSNDLRERAVAAVVTGGLSRRRAAGQFGLGVSTVIRWVRRCAQTGSVAPGRMGGPDPGEGLHPARAGGRAGRTRAQGGLPVGVELRPRREAELQKKPCSPASRIDPTSRDGVSSGSSIGAGSPRSAWSSSTRPGPRPTWHRCGGGQRAAPGSGRRSRSGAGKP